MPTGYKDYSVPINISAQELAEITNRPKYGGVVRGYLYSAVPAGDTVTLLNVSGQGMLYGGHLYISSTASIASVIPYLYIEGATIVNTPLSNYDTRNLSKPHVSPSYLISYNNTTFKCTIAYSYGYTFETSLKLNFVNMAPQSTIVSGALYYALI